MHIHTYTYTYVGYAESFYHTVNQKKIFRSLETAMFPDLGIWARNMSHL